jgi:hypothetical protein
MKFCPILWIDEIFIHKALESLELSYVWGAQIFDLFLDKVIKIFNFHKWHAFASQNFDFNLDLKLKISFFKS